MLPCSYKPRKIGARQVAAKVSIKKLMDWKKDVREEIFRSDWRFFEVKHNHINRIFIEVQLFRILPSGSLLNIELNIQLNIERILVRK